MAFSFSEADFDRISTVLGVPAKREASLVRFELKDESTGRRLALEIVPHLELPESTGAQALSLVSVYGANAFLQLHGCTGFVASRELGEVIFFARTGGTTSGLVVEREAGCSLYANVNDRLLSTDFTQLPPEVMMSSVALSMAETLLSDQE